jgi:hypothetical protein
MTAPQAFRVADAGRTWWFLIRMSSAAIASKIGGNTPVTALANMFVTNLFFTNVFVMLRS